MRTFIAPLPLNETELKGRKLFAQRCANCHGATAQRPGPPLGQQTVESLGDSFIREKVRKGSRQDNEHAVNVAQAVRTLAAEGLVKGATR